AKVNLKNQSKLGFTYLRPLQIAYESPRFMLPIRLGMANADGEQELFVYALTRQGRVETTNYRCVGVPTDLDVPLFVKAQFKEFYTALFPHQVESDQMGSVYLEYAWDMSTCDPCASPPLSPEELRQLGVMWMQDGPRFGRGMGQAFLTRLHARYDAQHFPED